eukprot:8520229-Pyramimonas_sp.AAC.1
MTKSEEADRDVGEGVAGQAGPVPAGRGDAALKADPEEKRPILCELYAGGMAATSEAQQRRHSYYETQGHPDRGRPQVTAE